MTNRAIRTHEDIQRDLEDVFDDIKDDRTDLRKASELNNTVGKWLKADALKLAWAHFDSGRPTEVALITDEGSSS
jgi:hypothetical protein